MSPNYTWKILLLTACLFTAACKKDNSVNNSTTTITALQLTNIAYGTDAKQNLDVYLPAGRNTDSTKAIILIHGGAWTSGDKADFTNIATTLQSQLSNYAVFNINYRLASITGTNLWPTQRDDANAAINFIVSKSTEYQFNKNKLVVLGASAGAQLALLNAYNANTDSRVKAVVDLFGPTNMADLYNNPGDPTYPILLTIFMSGTPTTNTTNYNSGSPLQFITTQTPPTIIFHGTADDIVPIRQSDSLHVRLNNAGVINQFVTYNGAGHGWAGDTLTDTWNKTIAFIKQYVQ